MWIAIGLCVGLLVLVAERLIVRAWVRRERRKDPARIKAFSGQPPAPDMENVSVGNVYIRKLRTSGNVRVHATSNGVSVELDEGGRVSAVINGQEIEEELAPGEKRTFS